MSETPKSTSRGSLYSSLVTKSEPDTLTPKQQNFLNHFISRYNSRRMKSKEWMKHYRPVFSDWVNVVGYRQSLKEIRYPIVCRRSSGSKIWDIDGNEYIDIAMGYGISFLGHNPEFVISAVERQLKEGLQLAPQFELTGEVAEMICELTGSERVVFSNTGTEAVVASLRIARAATGRYKVVLFEGSYHGHSDGIMVKKPNLPLAAGTPPGMVEDMIMLDYGSDEAIDTIRSMGDKLAAVLVEPCQTKKPGNHSETFLRKLRQVTTEIGAALIFDEIVSGFRVHPGGAQGYFGIQADIATYGKTLGGGMPIGIIAGKARFIDAVDMGMWNYGDDSLPQKKTTIFAGTFCKHPLSMAAALEALRYFKKKGVALQEEVNRRTSDFANRMNKYFKENHVPVEVKYFSSLFKFESYGKYALLLQPIEIDLLFYLMMEKGVYTWEMHNSFLSTAHTDADIARIIQIVKESVEELREGGFSFSSED
jgi:iturin family lipopeptide synthetase A